MTICIFTGPTLPPAEAARILDAEYLPPAAIGDVYRVACGKPWAIGIIDGIFENIPSVWHKEILWAMAQGIHVFGAASMGALRAAELCAYGMVGVGRIFEAYRDGEIEDDDEVAVVHGPPELGYIQTSEAMVNIRATLRRAMAEGVIPPADGKVLIGLAKSLYYKQRGYDRLLTEAARHHLSPETIAALKAWLPANRVNQKRLDAIEMLEQIGRMSAAERTPKEVSYHFERTTFWMAVERQYAPAAESGNDRSPAAETDELLEELRLNASLFHRIQAAALLRALMRSVLGEQGWEPSVAQLQEATRRFVRDRKLQSADELDAWLEDRSLSRDDFLQLMADEKRRETIERSLGPTVAQVMVDELRLGDDFTALRQRVRHKRDVLQRRGVASPALSDSGLSDQQLTQWIMEFYAPGIAADSIDAMAEILGFGDADGLRRAALREYCYRLWKDS